MYDNILPFIWQVCSGYTKSTICYPMHNISLKIFRSQDVRFHLSRDQLFKKFILNQNNLGLEPIFKIWPNPIRLLLNNRPQWIMTKTLGSAAEDYGLMFYGAGSEMDKKTVLILNIFLCPVNTMLRMAKKSHMYNMTSHTSEILLI